MLYCTPLCVLQLYREAIPKFQEFLLAAMDPELRTGLMALQVQSLKLLLCDAATGKLRCRYLCRTHMCSSGFRLPVLCYAAALLRPVRRWGRQASRRCSPTLPSLYWSVTHRRSKTSGGWGTGAVGCS